MIKVTVIGTSAQLYAAESILRENFEFELVESGIPEAARFSNANDLCAVFMLDLNFLDKSLFEIGKFKTAEIAITSNAWEFRKKKYSYFKMTSRSGGMQTAIKAVASRSSAFTE